MENKGINLSDELAVSEGSLVERISEGAVQVSRGQSMIDIYQRQTKLVYLIDISYSMLQHFGTSDRTKMSIVREAASKFVSRRFDQYKDSEISVIAFNESAQKKSNCRTKEEVLAVIAGLEVEGMTNIYKALLRGLEDCETESRLKLRHIILITDGCDNHAMEVGNLLPRLTAAGIVVDVILIGSSGPADGALTRISVMQNVCKQTGGEFIQVTDLLDFEQKLLKVSERLCLPPGQ